MGYVALALSLTGFALGVLVRMKVLLPILLALLLASIIFSIARGLSVVDAVLTVFLAQAIVQWAYFIGVIARGVFVRIQSQPRANGNKVLQRIDESSRDAATKAAQLKGVD
jgi:hypothetical protein